MLAIEYKIDQNLNTRSSNRYKKNKKGHEKKSSTSFHYGTNQKPFRGDWIRWILRSGTIAFLTPATKGVQMFVGKLYNSGMFAIGQKLIGKLIWNSITFVPKTIRYLSKVAFSPIRLISSPPVRQSGLKLINCIKNARKRIENERLIINKQKEAKTKRMLIPFSLIFILFVLLKFFLFKVKIFPLRSRLSLKNGG